jgi:plastocyanin
MKRGHRLGLVVAALAVMMGLGSTTAIKAQQSGSTITIGTDSADPKYTYTFDPAELDAKVGQAITVTNQDQNGVHSVTAQDKTFNVDVPPGKTVTFTIQKAGKFPYYCQYHSDQHNPASITVS